MVPKEINTEDLLKDKKISANKYLSHLVDPLYMIYQELYHKTNYTNKSVTLNNDNKILIPITEDKNEKYSFYGNPIKIISDNHISKIDYLEIQNYFEKIKSEKLFIFEIKDESNLINNNFEQIEKIFYEINIDLFESIEKIKSNFSSNTRNEIKRNYEDSKYEIIDKKNYKKDQIFEMMDLHIKISGKKTRTEHSWKQNEKMIMNDRGFLIKVTYKGKLVSYSFFFYNEITCRYFSSVSNREYYKLIKNMHHKTLWMAINFVKEKCKFFNIGEITIFSKKDITDKEKNIEKFKKKFKGINSKFVVLNSFPEYNFYKKFILG